MSKLVYILSNNGSKIKVAECKKKCIENIVSVAPKCRQIDAIVLFGSALEERCTTDSDIDIAIISRYGIGKLSALKSFGVFIHDLYRADEMQEYDRLYFRSIDEIASKRKEAPICNEILNKGEIIYKKKKLHVSSI